MASVCYYYSSTMHEQKAWRLPVDKLAWFTMPQCNLNKCYSRGGSTQVCSTLSGVIKCPWCATTCWTIYEGWSNSSWKLQRSGIIPVCLCLLWTVGFKLLVIIYSQSNCNHCSQLLWLILARAVPTIKMDHCWQRGGSIEPPRNRYFLTVLTRFLAFFWTLLMNSPFVTNWGCSGPTFIHLFTIFLQFQ